MIYAYDQIRSVHLEITDKCNASCPMCARNKFGGPENEYLPQTELSLSDLQTIMNESFVQQLDRLYMCGNFGDPIAAADTLEVFQWLRTINPSIRLGMHTNGSARNDTWWQRLGTILNQPGDYVKFGIDGLEDTNHIYRRSTNFNKIMENATAFIAAGGQAHWEYIVFRHNEHQVAEARQRSLDLGFKNFRIKKTGRFFSNTRLEGKDKQEVWTRNGELEYYIEKPTLAQYQNDSLQREQDIIDRYGSMQSYLDQTPIHCKVAEDKSIYISAEGLVLPCCWTANQLYVWYNQYMRSEIWDLIDHDITNISALHYNMKMIIEGSYFKDIADSWSRSSIADGKLKTCAKTCGKSFDQFTSQFEKQKEQA